MEDTLFDDVTHQKVLQIFIQVQASYMKELQKTPTNVVLVFKLHPEKYSFLIMRNNYFILFCVNQIPTQVLFSSRM